MPKLGNCDWHRQGCNGREFISRELMHQSQLVTVQPRPELATRLLPVSVDPSNHNDLLKGLLRHLSAGLQMTLDNDEHSDSGGDDAVSQQAFAELRTQLVILGEFQ